VEIEAGELSLPPQDASPRRHRGPGARPLGEDNYRPGRRRGLTPRSSAVKSCAESEVSGDTFSDLMRWRARFFILELENGRMANLCDAGPSDVLLRSICPK
jgi:hypothetical protein